MTATSLEIEQAKQRRWRLRPRHAQVRWFDQLIVNEFLSPNEQAARQAQALRNIVGFAARHVPYYRDLFSRLGLGPDDIRQPADLARLPILTRGDVRAHSKDLTPYTLPPGQRLAWPTKTTGSTGEPVIVQHTHQSHLMFTILKQRDHRWADLDPMWTAAAIYSPRNMPRLPDGKMAADGVTVRQPAWTHVGAYFFTGPYVGFDAGCPVDKQLAWLDEHRPEYLLSFAASLEHLALACQDRPPPDYLRAIKAVAHQFTPAMRRAVEGIFKVPVQDGYGFNEIGLVAIRCHEGGRFHVHAEHCLVEIVGADGKPCPPGEFGRILVTGLSNLAMPLFRYDPDDLVLALAGPCPCGRTLPSFGAIQGRYRRIAYLPPGAWRQWEKLQEAITRMPAELTRPVRKYQLHHHRDGRYVLRIVAAAALAPAYREHIEAAWHAADPEGAFPLQILEVNEIPPQGGVKFQNFTSDLVPPPDWDGQVQLDA